MNIEDAGDRNRFIQEIIADENRARREEHFKRKEVYNSRQAPYVEAKLIEEFGRQSVKDMRKIYSINLTERIIKELSSIYMKAPDRMWTEVDEEKSQEIGRVYQAFRVNEELKRGNRGFKLSQQGTFKCVPKEGKLVPMWLSPDMYDVIPDPEDPRKAKAYVMSALDRRQFLKDAGSPSRSQNIGNSMNERIADVDDYLAQAQFIWWTKDWHLTTDGHGRLIADPVQNPINALPFIDVAGERDFEYWVRAGSDVVQFNIEFAAVLSDLFNIIRMQGYSQAYVIADKLPKNLRLGPMEVLHLKQNQDSGLSPEIGFASPTPDITSSIESLEMLVRLFLSGRGISAKTIAAREGGESFSSGLERLLAMLEKFQASADDIDCFRRVEDDYYKLFKKWQNASSNNDLIADEYKVTNIPEDSEVEVSFHEPEMIQTQKEREDSAIALMEAGLMSRKQAIAQIHNITEEAAEEIILQIDSEDRSLDVSNQNIEQEESAPEDQPEEITGQEPE